METTHPLRGRRRSAHGAGHSLRQGVRILAAAALLLGGGAASAAPVSTTASLALDIRGFAALSIAGAGSASVSGTTLRVGAGLISQTASIVVPVTSTTVVESITAVNIANLPGTFSLGGAPASQICAGVTFGVACDSGGGIGGAMSLVGTINVRVNAFVNIPVHLSTVKIGQGGAFITPGTSISGSNGVWTTRQAIVNATVSGVSVPIPATGAGSPLTLVTPTFVNAFGGTEVIPVFGKLTLKVPEPGTLLLLVSGVAGLMRVGRRS